MDRSAIFWTARLSIGLLGVVLIAGGIGRLGRHRAAANWPSAPPVGRATRPLGLAGLGAGLLLLATAVALGADALAGAVDTAVTPETWRGWLVGGVAAGAVLAAGALITSRLVRRAEVTALIRTPSAARPIPAQDRAVQHPAGHRQLSTSMGDADPAVPSDGQPGWVYRDGAGDWYLAVAVDGGQGLVRLTDFVLVPPGTAVRPLALEGSVELAVLPPEARQGSPARDGVS
jgi:hypothetical protein